MSIPLKCSAAAILVMLWAIAVSGQEAENALEVFDTGASSAPRKDWKKLEEGDASHDFAGDAVLSNGRIMLKLPKGAAGAELCATGRNGTVLRALLVPVTERSGSKLTSVSIDKSAGGMASVHVSFGDSAAIRCEMQIGQPFVKTEPLRGVKALRVDAPCRFAVLPDFFAADMVVDAADLPVGRCELPSENFLLHMMPGGQSIVLAVWNQRQEDVRVQLAGRGGERRILASEVPYGAKGNVSVALLEHAGIWHSHNVAKSDADKVIATDWHAPFPAQWRMDWRQDDGLTDSWEMLHEKPDGTYQRYDWFGQSDAYGTPDWMQGNRKRWTTVLGMFQYPCWIDKSGRGFIQPLKKPGRFEGPALIYPIARTSTTPLTAYTFVDIVRDTLGVGPCEYVLDVEGQKKKSEGIPTCATRTKLNGIYSAKQQKQKKAEVEKALDDVHAFMRHIRGRIEAYVVFGHQTLAYLQDQKKEHPELAKFIAEMETAARRIDAAVEQRAKGIHTPEYAEGLVNEFRRTLVDYDGADALERCKKITAGFVEIGGNQDELVGECRLAVKILRQKAGFALAVEPRTAPIARDIRRRTQEMLRNPTSYEAPRH